MIQIRLINESDYPRLVEIWESAVRATHDFLTEDDFQYYKSQLPEYFGQVRLYGVEADGRLIGFIGLDETKVEMLFVENKFRGSNVGRQLMEFAINELGAFQVDVNEQNTQAVSFYRHLGFRITSRSQTDAEGKAYPVLHLEIDNESPKSVR